MEESTKVDTRLFPRLTRSNWHTEYKEAFREYALTMGEAGTIIIEGVNLALRRPRRDMRALGADGNEDPAGQLIYPDTERGDRNYEKYEQKYQRIREGKQRMMSKLLSTIDRDIKEALTTSPGYENIYNDYDILGMWQLLEQVVLGRGAISVYALIGRLLEYNQSGSYNKYDKEFKEMVTDLLAQGNPQDILTMIFNALFIMRLNQTQFKDVLTPIYGRRQWPTYQDLSAELHVYAQQMERMKDIRRDNSDGRISANAAKVGGETTICCWNCGATEHLRRDCPETLSKCSNCGRTGHLKKFCRSKESQDNRTRDISSSKNIQKTLPKVSSVVKKTAKTNKAKQRDRLLSKITARLADLDLEEFDSDSDASRESRSSDEEDEESFEARLSSCIVDREDSMDDLASRVDCQALLSQSNPRKFIIDSGCRGAHIVQSMDSLATFRSADSLRRRPIITGIGGAPITSDGIGTFHNVNGKVLVAPQADANLLSLMEMIKPTNGSFTGDCHRLVLKDGTGKEILTAVNDGDDFWSCTDEDLGQATKVYLKSNIDIDQAFRHLNAEERHRARDAHELCGLLRHPGEHAILSALEGGCFINCHLTAQDYRNSIRLYGRCIACTEGKMRSSPFPASVSEPAREIGQHLHSDFIILKNKSIGGNTLIMVTVCEKSSYLVGIPIKQKTAKCVLTAAKETLVEFNRYDYRVKSWTTDDENAFKTLRQPLGEDGIDVNTTPAGLHERRIERYIQTIKDRRRSMLAALSYKLPPELEAESYIEAIRWMNQVPSLHSGAMTPNMLVTGRKSFLPQYYFGQIGLFLSKNKATDTRSEWGIFLGFGSHSKYLRAYMPSRGTVHSKYKFEPQPAVPAEWNLSPRLSKLPPASSTPSTDATVAEDSIAIPTPNVHVQSGNPLLALPPATSAHTDPKESAEHTEPANDLVGIQEADVTDDQEVVTTDDREVVISDSRPSSTGSSEGETTQTAETLDLNPSIPVQRRSQRSNRGSWLDGPSQSKTSQYITARKAPSPRQDNVTTLLARLFYDKQADVYKAMKTSLKLALADQTRRPNILKSIEAEINNLEAPGVLTAVKLIDIPTSPHPLIIDSYMFHKEKFKADGSFDKDKCRIVLLSNRRPPESIGESFSPTVNSISVFTQLNLAAVNNSVISSYDVKGAFLLTPTSAKKNMYLRVSGELAQYWTAFHPNRAKYLDDKGRLHFKMNRYVYGLHESPREFNNLLDKRLKEMGFLASRADPCLYTRDTPDGRMILSVHVDDLLLTCPSVKLRDWFEKIFGKHFPLVTQHDNVSYLGMMIKKSKTTGDISLSQRGLLEGLLAKHGVLNLQCPPSTPATEKFMVEDPDSPLCDKRAFLSLVMSIMYVARFTRPDVLMPVSYLATKCSCPNEDHWNKLIRILKYLSGTVTEGLCFDSAVPFRPYIAADASHHLYKTGHGQQALIVSNGSAPVAARSTRIKMVTRSSSESELCALEDASTYAVWYRLLLTDMGVNSSQPIPILQDNKSTIIMAMQGPTFNRTKHLIGRRTYIRERIEAGDVQLSYQPTGEMTADILTKPLPKSSMMRLKKLINVVSIN